MESVSLSDEGKTEFGIGKAACRGRGAAGFVTHRALTFN
jgi:hypothetical protein